MDAYERDILHLNEQLGRQGLLTARLFKLRRARADAVVICGMGGSGLPGEILRAVSKEIGLNVPVFIHKDYGLPELRILRIRRPLYIFVSFSGNTEETLSSFATAWQLRPRPALAIVTTGGRLLREAETKALPVVTFVPGDLTPRLGTGRMFYGLLEILHAAGLLARIDFDYTHLRPNTFRAIGQAWAKHLRKRLTLIYTDASNYDIGYIWKIKFNETAKQEAFLNILPEMNHNELVPLVKPNFKTAAIFITEARPAASMAKRIRINRSLLTDRGIPVWAPQMTGKTRLERTWRMLMLADWTTYFLARENKVDPMKVAIVEELKARLRR